MLFPRQFIVLTFVLLGTFASVGVLHGLWTERWMSPLGNQGLVEMEKVPLTVGTWEGKSEERDARTPIQPDAENFLRRRYVNRADGTVANVLLTHGKPGPMVVKHLPTECYPSAGFETVVQPKQYISQSTDASAPDEFWVATFKKSSGATPLTVRVYWSWSGDGQWQTPARPRLTFARYPVLYKLYVVQNIPTENEEFEGAPVHDLIKELTASMRKTLFASASASAR